MRDYRGKRTDNGAWVKGAFSAKDCDTPFGELVDRPSIIKYEEPCSGFWFRVDPETVGQCTGIMGDFVTGEPKAGDTILRSFIYEGDIVEAVLTDGIHQGFSWGRHVVVFDQGAFCLKNRRGEITPMCNYSVNVKFKVLGNIHDNPELMEVQA